MVTSSEPPVGTIIVWPADRDLPSGWVESDGRWITETDTDDPDLCANLRAKGFPTDGDRVALPDFRERSDTPPSWRHIIRLTAPVCWRSECQRGCAYPSACSEKPSEPPSDSSEGVGGPTTHAPPVRDFRWPCERRTAHEPHDDCPGVKAHPNTMIGKP